MGNGLRRREILAVVFDFDGLIVDTETPEYEAWRQVYRARGVDLPLAEWAPHIGAGRGGFDVYSRLEELTGSPVDRVSTRREHETRFEALYANAAPLPGVQAHIAAARERGLPLGVASSSARSWVAPKLERLNLVDAFDTVVCVDDVGAPKPSPDLYLAAAANLGVEPAQALALEDSANGAWGAKNAGLLCVVVPGAMTRGQSFDHADARLSSLSDMPLGRLLALVAERGS